MLRNYLTTLLRNARRYSGYTTINVLGLACGIACCLLVLLYVHNELSYDTFHDGADRIYRVWERGDLGDDVYRSAGIPIQVGQTVQAENPDLTVTRLFRLRDRSPLVRHEDRTFYEDRFFWADSMAFEVFSGFAFIHGRPETALDEPGDVVLTESAADRYFGTDNPVGQTITVENEHTYTVSAVVEDVPSNSHLQFDVVASIANLPKVLKTVGIPLDWYEGWYWNPSYCYVKVPAGVSAADLDARLTRLKNKYLPDWLAKKFDYRTQPLTSIHLTSHLKQELERNSSWTYIYVYASVAVLILLIACINYVNLATARATTRAQEVGIRKAVGADRSQILQQFLGESTAMAGVAVVLGLGLAAAGLPAFERLVGKDFQFDLTLGLFVLAGAAVTLLVVGLLAGGYPAFYLSRFRPAGVLRGSGSTGSANPTIRRALVAVQFAVSIGLLAAVGLVSQQARFLVEKDLGFRQDDVLVLSILGTEAKTSYDAFEQQLEQQPAVRGVSAVRAVVGTGGVVAPVAVPGRTGDDAPQWPTLSVSADFTETMGVDVLAGRSFSARRSTDTTDAYVINEVAAARFGWSPQEAVGKPIGIGKDEDDVDGRVIGVVENFHFGPLRNAVGPLVMDTDRDDLDFALVHTVGGDASAARSQVEAVWNSFEPNRPLEFTYLDDRLDALYASEQRLDDVLFSLTIFAVFTACLGLFGLASFSARQRRTEIGVRKALGASTSRIAVLLSADFLRPVAAAVVIGCPLAFLGVREWLQSFAYRTDVGALPFVLSVTVILVVAQIAVTYQVFRAARTDPAQTLRFE
jgi:putative ABC transport system permease protein